MVQAELAEVAGVSGRLYDEPRGLEQNSITEAGPGTHSKQPSTKERPSATSKQPNAKKKAQAKPASDAEVAKRAPWTAADEGPAGNENTTADSAEVATRTEVSNQKGSVRRALDGVNSMCAPTETLKCGQGFGNDCGHFWKKHFAEFEAHGCCNKTAEAVHDATPTSVVEELINIIARLGLPYVVSGGVARYVPARSLLTSRPRVVPSAH